MKKLFLGAAVAALFAASAHAQTTTTAPDKTMTAPSTTATPDPGAPLPGANSFTEAQARTRIEKLGYTNVTGLAKDANGIWRGTAMKDGLSQKVSLDFRGNIVVGQK